MVGKYCSSNGNKDGLDPGQIQHCAVLCDVGQGDFAVKFEAKRVLVALQDMGLDITAGFKLDLFTHLQVEIINPKNIWRLPPGLYIVTEVLEW